MSDPLSVIASIAGLIEIAASVSKHCYTYVKEAKGASKEISKLLEGVTEIFGVLQSLKLVAQRFEGDAYDPSIQTHYIQSCQNTLEHIRSRLDEANPLKDSSRRRAFLKKLEWPFKITETKDLTIELEKQKSTLSLALSADSISVLLLALSRQESQSRDLATIKTEVQYLHKTVISDQRRKLLNSLELVNPRSKQESSLKLRHQGTGLWIRDDTSFQSWLTNDNAKLWLYGIPGAGKTVLVQVCKLRSRLFQKADLDHSSTIIEALQKTEYEDAGLAYFYCDYVNTATSDPANILGSLIKQLAIRDDLCFKDLEDFHEKLNIDEKSPRAMTVEELVTILKVLVLRFEQTFIVIDGLDECTDRATVIPLLKDLSVPGQNNVKILFSSRQELELVVLLVDYNQVSIAARSSDLRLYVESEISKVKVRSSELKDKIRRRLIEDASGMFRWVSCQLDYLSKLPSDAARRKALESLPRTLHATYERILATIESEENQILVRRTLIWIMYATKPLSVRALLQAVSINDGDTQLDEDCIPDEEAVRSCCGCLVKSTSNGEGLELAHFTVKEFLLDEKKDSSFMQYHVRVGEGDTLLAKTCLSYLCFPAFDVFEDSSSSDIEECSETEKLYDYAATCWDKHAYGHLDDESVQKIAKVLFAPSKTAQFIRWAQFVSWVYGGHEKDDFEGRCDTPLHWAATLGLSELCAWLVVQISGNEHSGRLSPLQSALLCDELHGDWTDLEKVSESKIWRYPSRCKVVETLLQAGFEVNYKLAESYRYTPLALAIRIGDFTLTSLLLRAGALITKEHIALMEERKRLFTDSRWQVYVKELATARFSEEGKSAYIELALSETSDQSTLLGLLHDHVDLKLVDPGSALRKAAKWGQSDDILRLLSTPGLDPDIVDESDGTTALFHASRAGHSAVIKMLVERGCDVNRTSRDGTCVLGQAVLGGRMEVVRYLVDHGASLDYIDSDGRTAIHHAIWGESLEIVEFLFECKSVSCLKSKSKDGKTPAMVAAETGPLQILRQILESSEAIDIAARCEDGYTCLHYAVKSCDKEDGPEKIDLLLASGAVINSTTSDDSTPLCMISKCLECLVNEDKPISFSRVSRVVRCFKMLLSAGADPTLLRKDGKSILHLICSKISWLHCELLKELLLDSRTKNEAFLNAKDGKLGKGRTALHILVVNTSLSIEIKPSVEFDEFLRGHPKHDEGPLAEMVELICKQDGIEVNCRNITNQTPLILFARGIKSKSPIRATNQANIDVMRVLLSAGADPDLVCKYKATALHYITLSFVSGHISFKSFQAIDLLLEKNAKIDIEDCNGQSFFAKFFDRLQHVEWRSNWHQNLFQLARKLTERFPVEQIQVLQINGTTALQIAMERGYYSIARTLLERGIEVDCQSSQQSKRTALELACIIGCPKDIASTIVARSKNLNDLNQKGDAALHIAAREGQADLLEQLLLAGVDIDIRSRAGRTPLHVAAMHAQPKAFEMLLKGGSNLKLFATDQGRWSVAHMAARGGSLVICQTISKHSPLVWNEVAQVFYRNTSIVGAKFLPLHVAAAEGNLRVIKYLYENGFAVNLDVKTLEADYSPLLIAAAFSRKHVVEFLAREQVDIHARSSKDETAVYLAATGRYGPETPALVKMLLEYGISPVQKTVSGETAELAALRLRRRDIVKVIREHLQIRRDIEPLQNTSTSTTSNIGSNATKLKIKPSTFRDFEAAVTIGDMEECERLIKDGVDVNSPAVCGCSMLSIGLLKNHPETSALLLKNKAEVQSKMCGKNDHRLGYSAAHLAAEFGYDKILDEILKSSPALSDIGIEPIHLAALNGHKKCLELLLRYDESIGTPRRMLETPASTNSGVWVANHQGKKLSIWQIERTPLHLACHVDDPGTISYLLDQGAAIESEDAEFGTPLMFAVRLNKPHAVRRLLERGSNVHARTAGGLTSIKVAARYGHKDIFQLLRDEGADVMSRDNGGGTLLWGCHTALVQQLMDLGLDMTTPSVYGDSPISHAMKTGHVEEWLALLKVHSDYEHPQAGNLLNIACSKDRKAAVKTLIERVPDARAGDFLNHRSAVGTPLYISSYRGNSTIMTALLEAGVKIDIIGGEYGTALHAACAMGRVEATKLLLERGAKIEVPGEDGSVISAFDMAVHHPRVLEVLRKHHEVSVNSIEEVEENGVIEQV